jgi:hypothetical protein
VVFGLLRKRQAIRYVVTIDYSPLELDMAVKISTAYVRELEAKLVVANQAFAALTLEHDDVVLKLKTLKIWCNNRNWTKGKPVTVPATGLNYAAASALVKAGDKRTVQAIMVAGA